MSSIESALKSSMGAKVPQEYIEYQFCKEFHVLPHMLDELPEHIYRLYLEFMRADAEADKIRTLRSKHGKFRD